MNLTISCKLSTPDELLDKVPAPEITSFSINGVAGVINGDTISFDFRWSGLDVKDQAATFVSNARSIKIDNITQLSGVTRNNFATTISYKLTAADTTSRTYSVKTLWGYPFADTGQLLCSSGVAGDAAMMVCPQTITGQDGDHVNKPAVRSFTGPTQHATYTSDYTTKDNVTGLVWRSCGEGFTGAPPACTPGSSLTYTLNPNTAGPQCTALNSANLGAGYAGLKTWRLPTVEELSTLLTLDGSSPAIDTTKFSGTVADSYWSSSTYVPTPTDAWFVNFSGGTVDYNIKATAYRVRCVSGEAAAYAPQRTDNGDGTITDSSNNLLWQKCSMGLNNDATCSGISSTTNWTNSLVYCQGLALTGRTWRLPSARELQSIVSYATSNPTINASYFPATFGNGYWSSSTSAPTPVNAWYVTFLDGSVYNTIKTALYRVRCVSGL